MWSPPPPRPAIAQSYSRTPLPVPRARRTSFHMAELFQSPKSCRLVVSQATPLYTLCGAYPLSRGEVLCLSPLAPAMLGREN